MRLTEEERQLILGACARRCGPAARVKLFGSRVDDRRRGGDVDVLVELPDRVPSTVEVAVDLEAQLWRAFDGRKVDVVVADPATPPSPLLEVARRTGVPL